MSRDLTLWCSIAAGPVVWMAAFGANWSMSWWACIWQWEPGQFAVWAFALLITAASAFAAWSEWRKLGAGLPGEAGGAIARARAMAIGGMMLSAASFLLIVAQTIVNALQGACT